MKITICAFCFLCAATLASSQVGPVLIGTPQPIQMTEHNQHASEHAMGLESSLLSSSSYSYAKGEIPLAELGTPIYQKPLGDVAREYRKARAATKAPKAAKLSED